MTLLALLKIIPSEDFFIGVAVGGILLYIILKLWQYFIPTPYDPGNVCGNYSGTSINTMDSVDEVGEMISIYRAKRDTRNNILTAQGVEPICKTDSVRFGMEKLKKFIYNAEIQANNNSNGIQIDNETLGIRFYFAAYSNAPSSPPHANCEGRRTLVMVPTFFNGENHVDFDANNPNIQANTPYVDLFDSITAGQVTGQISALNKGFLFPPMD